jgi:hypothetical protein
MAERRVTRPCKDCGQPTVFRITGHIPSDLAMLCRRCITQRSRAIAAARSPKQVLRKPTVKKPRD